MQPRGSTSQHPCCGGPCASSGPAQNSAPGTPHSNPLIEICLGLGWKSASNGRGKDHSFKLKGTPRVELGALGMWHLGQRGLCGPRCRAWAVLSLAQISCTDQVESSQLDRRLRKKHVGQTRGHLPIAPTGCMGADQMNWHLAFP